MIRVPVSIPGEEIKISKVKIEYPKIICLVRKNLDKFARKRVESKDGNLWKYIRAIGGNFYFEISNG